jgi:hypothetical protein
LSSQPFYEHLTYPVTLVLLIDHCAKPHTPEIQILNEKKDILYWVARMSWHDHSLVLNLAEKILTVSYRAHLV